MKKISAIALTLVLCIGLLTGCGNKYSTTDSTLFLLKNGKVVATDVEAFDTNVYSVDELKSYVESNIGAYNTQVGDDKVELKNFKAENGKVLLTVEYASPEDYTAFTGFELFTGTVAEALKAGYSFTGDFASVEDGNVKEARASEFAGSSEYLIAIVKANVNVNVYGNVSYVSAQNTGWVNKNTIAVAEGLNMLGFYEEPVPSEAVEEDTQMLDAEEGVDVDELEELEDAEEEDTQIVFDFGEEESAGEGLSQFSDSYTYIIFKK